MDWVLLEYVNMASKDLTGLKFGLLTVKKLAGINKMYNYREWLCECECGNTTIVRGYSLTSNVTKSCGCLRKQKTSERTKTLMKTHGLSKTKLYKKWGSIKRNCYCRRNYNYKFYGLKGVAVCDEWLNDFMNFYNWSMENGYTESKYLIRKNKNGNYEPSNCYWGEEVIK